MTEKEKLSKLRTACQVVLARFRVAATKRTDEQAWKEFQQKGSVKEIITALKL